jgi:hypothetical protein
MRKNYGKLIVAGMLILVFMVGCSPKGNAINDGANGTASENKDSPMDTQSKQSEENKNDQTQSTPTAEELEKELAAYRAEREKGESSLGNYTLAKIPNEENYTYGVGPCNNGPDLDSRELNEAFEAASAYIEGTLKLESEAWECVDPRMTAIYEDEDKGVANGYDADNIFLCEYNDHGTWQYLILVREGKGSDWKVLYHGSSYKTEKNDGGEKNEKANMDGIPETVE